MGSVNKVILVGNLGRDAELKFTPGGFPISSFSIATTDRRRAKDSDQWEERTEWHRVKVLGKQAESLQDYLKKGKQIYVEGRLETRTWDDKDGQKKYMTEIIADRIQLLGSRQDGGSELGARAERAARGRRPDQGRASGGDDGDPFDDAGGQGGEVADDDIPF
jgi:single-strand DNA-binding protein